MRVAPQPQHRACTGPFVSGGDLVKEVAAGVDATGAAGIGVNIPEVSRSAVARPCRVEPVCVLRDLLVKRPIGIAARRWVNACDEMLSSGFVTALWASERLVSAVCSPR